MILNEIEGKRLKQIESDLIEIKHLLSLKGMIYDEWILSKDIPKILNICNKTWQTMRDNRDIPFTQFGSKIYVSRKDLIDFMDKHKVK